MKLNPPDLESEVLATQCVMRMLCVPRPLQIVNGCVADYRIMATQQGEFNFWLLLYSSDRNVYCYLSQGRRDGTSLLVVVDTALLLLGRVCSCGLDTRVMHPVFMTALRSKHSYLT